MGVSVRICKVLVSGKLLTNVSTRALASESCNEATLSNAEFRTEEAKVVSTASAGPTLKSEIDDGRSTVTESDPSSPDWKSTAVAGALPVFFKSSRFFCQSSFLNSRSQLLLQEETSTTDRLPESKVSVVPLPSV